jgi:hypothetical protein
MDRNVIAQISEDSLKIEDFLSGKSAGESISYDEISHSSGVEMNLRGKNLLRTTLKRLRFEYSPIRGYGIRLADASLVMPILSDRITKIDRAVKRAGKCQQNLQVQFFNYLTLEEQRQVLFAGAVFGAIRIAAENGRMLYGKKTKTDVVRSVKIPIPKI